VLLLLVVIVAILGGSAPARSAGLAYSAEVLADSPRAYWRLGESSGAVAADSSGTGNNGSYVNGPLLGQPGPIVGDPNTAVTFEGVNDYMTAPDSPSLDASTGVPVEAWVKRSKTGWQVVVGKPGDGRSAFENYALWFNSSNYLVAYFGNGTTYVGLSSPTAIDTAWHYVAASYAGGQALLYIDGVQRASATSSVALTPNNFTRGRVGSRA